MDDQTLLNSAFEDPHGFVAHGNELMIIDEVQRAPLLLPAVKKDVDENETPGRFILTGSANFQSLPKVADSDDAAHSFQDDGAQHSDLMAPTLGALSVIQ